MEAEARVSLRELRIDGGASKNQFLVQFQADILDVPVVRSAQSEASALGVAMMAGLATGVYKDLAALAALRKGAEIYRSAMDPETRSRLISGWRDAVGRTLYRTPG
jgi:glycerol kinase